MSNFVREPWIHSLLSAQLYHNTVPSTGQRCQLIDVVGEADALEVIVSDRTHSITAVLSRESIASFKKIYALDWVDVRGCLMTLDRFYFEYSFEKNAFFIHTEEFSYFGSEGEIVGDPISVNHAKDIREVLGHGMCGKLHICELDPLYGAAANETGEKRRALDALMGRCIGENAEEMEGSADIASPQEQGPVSKSEKAGGCTEVSGVLVCRASADLPEDETPSMAQEDGFSGRDPPSNASVEMRVGGQEECTIRNKEQHAAEHDVCKEPVLQVPERSGCEEEVSAAFAECGAANETLLLAATCRSREKGVIDFHGRDTPTNFDLTIFTKRKRSRSSGSNHT